MFTPLFYYKNVFNSDNTIIRIQLNTKAGLSCHRQLFKKIYECYE
jgi:hypothetical protein